MFTFNIFNVNYEMIRRRPEQKNKTNYSLIYPLSPVGRNRDPDFIKVFLVVIICAIVLEMVQL